MATAQVSPEPALGFPPKGSLRRVPFPRLIREVARNKLDGSLYLLSGQTKKVVFFESGQPVFVRSNVLSECLGQILAQEGLITQEQCEQTLEAIRRTGKKQGELLVEMGILSEGNLRYGLEAQLRAKLFDIFSWEEGRYQFKDDPPELHFGITLKSSAEGVIVEAIQDQYTEERAGEALDAVASKCPVVLGDAVESAELVLLPQERHFVACLDGSRTIRELLGKPTEGSDSTPRALLCGLLLAGLIKLADGAQPRTDWPDPPSDAEDELSDADFAPGFEALSRITEYEDTPLPGELPQSPLLLGDHEDGFVGVEDSAVVPVAAILQKAEAREVLVAAEPDSIEETFDDDQIELVEETLDPDAPPLLVSSAEGSAIEVAPDAGIDLDAPGSTDPIVDFAPDIPTTVEPSGPPPGAPEPVSTGSTMPTPDGEAPSSSAAPNGGPTMPPLLDLPDPAPPPAIGAANMGVPAATAPESVDAAAPASEDDLLSLSPDDDLLMADDQVEAVAHDLLGDNSEQSPALVAVPEPGSPQLDPSMDAIESIEPVALDSDSFEADAIEEESVVEVSPEDLELAEEDEQPAPAAAASAPAPAAVNDDLLDFDDLDQIDLGGDDDDDEQEEEEPQADDDVVSALRYNEAQTAMTEERFADAVPLLEQAYAAGFDVAELHAMLAYARFQAAGRDEHTAQHAFELLDYAQQMDPSLDLVHAYRGAILRAQGDIPDAREALERALELNPYCELAMEIMDAIG
ncbi:MAG: DUF4388 domain-containing protein [Deltaproteobacteria bacterium]|nr:DUF4388 domain-containing protein [Deltaproteobacteria bacterium]